MTRLIRSQPCRIGDGIEAAIEDPVTAIGHERLTRRHQAQPGARAEPREGYLGRFQAEVDDLHGDWAVFTEPVHQLGAVDDDRKASARRGNNFLP